ncbi:unnamed protein product [Protopolystoma xenopodis]|uniref:Uncharacterized protein n=1 Tax=Protopolystoma xenopodis TaxID=117903 RepID=A0A448WGK9_9PLAT|nr:unnamed protein product [Protopolystoma xenopodis]
MYLCFSISILAVACYQWKFAVVNYTHQFLYHLHTSRDHHLHTAKTNPAISASSRLAVPSVVLSLPGDYDIGSHPCAISSPPDWTRALWPDLIPSLPPSVCLFVYTPVCRCVCINKPASCHRWYCTIQHYVDTYKFANKCLSTSVGMPDSAIPIHTGLSPITSRPYPPGDPLLLAHLYVYLSFLAITPPRLHSVQFSHGFTFTRCLAF